MHEIIEYLVGIPVTKILQNHNLSKSTFYRRLNKCDVPKRPNIEFLPLIAIQIKLDYESGDTIDTIADKYDGTYFTISRILKFLDVKTRGPSKTARKYTDEEINKALENYQSGLPAHECGASGATVLRWLKDRSISARNQPDYGGKADFFKTLSTKESKYWFGFLCADGSIAKKKYVEINLALKDKKHLELFKKHLDYHKPIKEVEQYNKRRGKLEKWANLLFGCSQAVRDLTGHGIINIKNGDFSPLTTWSQEDFRTFLLGYFDGDGSIYKVHPKNKPFWWRWYICCKHRHLVEYLLSRCPVVSRHNAVWSGTVWRVEYGGNQLVPKICDWLYEDQRVYLDRKRNLALRAIANICI